MYKVFKTIFISTLLSWSVLAFAGADSPSQCPNSEIINNVSTLSGHQGQGMTGIIWLSSNIGLQAILYPTASAEHSKTYYVTHPTYLVGGKIALDDDATDNVNLPTRCQDITIPVKGEKIIINGTIHRSPEKTHNTISGFHCQIIQNAACLDVS